MRARMSRNLSTLFKKCTANLYARLDFSDKLAQLEIPKGVINCVMIHSPDILELNPLEVAEAYFQLIGLGLTKTAAATIASLDYPDREREDALSIIARNYHTTRLSPGYSHITPHPILFMRHKKVAGYSEARLAFKALLDYEEEVLRNAWLS